MIIDDNILGEVVNWVNNLMCEFKWLLVDQPQGRIVCALKRAAISREVWVAK